MQALSLILDIIAALLSPFIKVLKWIYGQSPFRVERRKPLPKLGIIESSWREHVWEYAKKGDKEVIAIHTHWQITNTLPYNLTALNVFLTKPECVKGRMLIRHFESDIWGAYPIPKGYTTEINASFVVDRKHVKNAEDVVKAKIELQDATGRIHKIGQVVINPIRKSSAKKRDSFIIEDPSKIENKTEKQVVAVLKNEVQQYKVRGRREGRLGTIEWPRGTLEWRDSDSKVKFLFENSNKGNVSSEHLGALLNLFKNSSKKEKEHIIGSLLERIDKKKEYREVGYLIILFLFEINHLEEGLDVALKKLQGDKANAFGDVLMIIDILLAFRYAEFQESQLDAIESFVYSIKEHPFRIKERINAIRVRKMLSKACN